MQDSSKSDFLIIQALRSRKFRATPQRIAICKIALGSRKHPSIQEIYREVKKIHSTVSLATVYKALNILKESGLIQELNFPQGKTRWDPYLEPHINLVCLRCGVIKDVNDANLRELVKKAATKARFAPTAQRIDVYGLCENCSKATKPD
jgi:Fur family peroxide stress response transcriptional regulator